MDTTLVQAMAGLRADVEASAVSMGFPDSGVLLSMACTLVGMSAEHAETIPDFVNSDLVQARAGRQRRLRAQGLSGCKDF